MVIDHVAIPASPQEEISCCAEADHIHFFVMLLIIAAAILGAILYVLNRKSFKVHPVGVTPSCPTPLKLTP